MFLLIFWESDYVHRSIKRLNVSRYRLVRKLPVRYLPEIKNTITFAYLRI